jgi:hypothetical protein
MTKEIDYVELLKLAHEKLGNQSDMIAELKSNILMLEQYNGSVESLIKDIKAHNLGQQAMGRLDGVAYALNMYCTTMSPKEFPPIGKYYADQLKGKALKEQE